MIKYLQKTYTLNGESSYMEFMDFGIIPPEVSPPIYCDYEGNQAFLKPCKFVEKSELLALYPEKEI